MARALAILTALAVSCGGARRDEPVDWDRKDAFRACAPAIAAYPARPAPPCAAMHMCANEAALTPVQEATLETMVRATPGCAPL